MKRKFLLLLTSFCLLFSFAFAQQAVLFEDFETWPAPGWKTYQFTSNGSWFHYPSGKNGKGMRHKIEGAIVAHNNWMVSPAINVTTNDYLLSLDVWMSGGVSESMNIMISTGSGVPTATNGSFTLLQAHSISTGWWPSAPLTVDLSAYAGQTVYIGIQMKNTPSLIENLSAVIDNFSVAPTGAYTNAALTTVVAPTGFSASAGNQNITTRIKNKGNQPLSNYTVNWSVDGAAQGVFTGSQTIAAGATLDVTLGAFNFTNGNHVINATINTTADIELSDNSITSYYSVGTLQDAAVTGVWPYGSARTTGTQPVILTIQNNGTAAMSNFRIDWSINGGTSTTYTETAISIPAGEAKNITVGNYNFSSATAQYTIEGKLVDPYDANQSNNIKTVRYSASRLEEDFNDKLLFPLHNWTNELTGPFASVTHSGQNAQLQNPENWNASFSGDVTDVAYMWTPQLVIQSGDVFKFMCLPANYHRGLITIVYRSGPGAPIQTLSTVGVPANYWKAYSVNISAAAGVNQIGIKTEESGYQGWTNNYDDITSTAPYAFPINPGNLNASSITSSGAQLNWLASPTATGYTVQYRPVGGTTWSSVTTAGNSYAMTSLAGGTTYEVQVRANNAYGSSEYSASIIFSTLTPCPAASSILAPASLTAYKFYLAQYITWPAVTHPNLIGYNIYFNKNNGSPVTVTFVDATKTSWVQVFNAQPGNYTYEIRSVIQLNCEGSVQTIESAGKATAGFTYTANEGQCNLFGIYQIEFQNIGGFWYTNVYQKNGAGAWVVWITVPTAIDHLFMCAQYGGTPYQKATELSAEMINLKQYLEEQLCGTTPAYCESNLNLSEPTSVADKSVHVNGIQVFPNPANDLLNYTITLQNEKVSYVAITDALGRELIRKNSNLIGQNQIELSSDMPTGIYYLKVVTETDCYTKRFSVVK